jgi:hypothetical protein
VVAGAGLAKGLLGVAIGAVLQPDCSLYAQGGLGLFPSPLGRLVGLGGVPAIAALNVAANVLLVLGVYALARALGGSGLVAGLIAVVSPLGVWSLAAGMDTIAAALLVWAAWAWLCGRLRAAAGLAALAVGFHLAALVVVVAALVSRRPWVAIGCAAAGALAALATQYGTIVRELDPVALVTTAAGTAAIYGLSFLPVLDRLRFALPAIAGCALAAGLVASRPFEVDARYMLPAVAIGAACCVRADA